MIPQYSVNFNAVTHSSAGTISMGMAVIQTADRTGWLPATAANMSAAGVTLIGGISLDSTSTASSVIRVQTDGMIVNEITGLGTGAATYVRVNTASARLERVAAPAGTDVVCGQCNEHGDVFLNPVSGLVAAGQGAATTLNDASGNVAIGDIIVPATATTWVRATATNVANAGRSASYRVATSAGVSGQTITSAKVADVIASAVFSDLGAGTQTDVYLDTSSARLKRLFNPGGGELLMGFVNADGTVSFYPKAWISTSPVHKFNPQTWGFTASTSDPGSSVRATNTSAFQWAVSACCSGGTKTLTGTVNLGTSPIVLSSNTQTATMAVLYGSGPQPTITGTPSSFFVLSIRITQTGTNSTAQFEWSTDGFQTTSVINGASPLTASGSGVVIPGTGLTVTFPSGTYNYNTCYGAGPADIYAPTLIVGWDDHAPVEILLRGTQTPSQIVTTINTACGASIASLDGGNHLVLTGSKYVYVEPCLGLTTFGLSRHPDGGTIEIPPGRYYVNGPLGVGTKVRVSACDINTTIAVKGTTCNGVEMRLPANLSYAVYNMFDGLNIESVDNSTGAAIFLLCGSFIGVDRVTVTGFRESILPPQCEFLYTDKCVFNSTGRGVKLDSMPQWKYGTAYNKGDRVIAPNQPADGIFYQYGDAPVYYECVKAGTSGGAAYTDCPFIPYANSFQRMPDGTCEWVCKADAAVRFSCSKINPLWSDGFTNANAITRCNFNCVGAGVLIEDAACYQNFIGGSNNYNNSDGGVIVTQASRTTITENSFENTWGAGVYICISYNTYVAQNTFLSAGCGVKDRTGNTIAYPSGEATGRAHAVVITGSIYGADTAGITIADNIIADTFGGREWCSMNSVVTSTLVITGNKSPYSSAAFKAPYVPVNWDGGINGLFVQETNGTFGLNVYPLNRQVQVRATTFREDGNNYNFDEKYRILDVTSGSSTKNLFVLPSMDPSPYSITLATVDVDLKAWTGSNQAVFRSTFSLDDSGTSIASVGSLSTSPVISNGTSAATWTISISTSGHVPTVVFNGTAGQNIALMGSIYFSKGTL